MYLFLRNSSSVGTHPPLWSPLGRPYSLSGDGGGGGGQYEVVLLPPPAAETIEHASLPEREQHCRTSSFVPSSLPPDPHLWEDNALP